MKRLLLCSALLLPAGLGFAQPPGRGGPPPRGGGPTDAALSTPWKAPDVGVQWFTSWEAAKAEAGKTGRPILLVSAAPHCAGVSGLW
jgi:hypothetical protein